MQSKHPPKQIQTVLTGSCAIYYGCSCSMYQVHLRPFYYVSMYRGVFFCTIIEDMSFVIAGDPEVNPLVDFTSTSTDVAMLHEK